MTRIELLLKNGFLPSQVPPCFHTTDLSRKAYAITRKLNKLTLTAKRCINIRPELFSVARIGHSRRLTSIVNPITQFYLAQKIARNWKRIVKYYSRADFSLSKPELGISGTRAISFTPVRNLQDIRITESAGYKYVLISDISQFFPTVYTHTIGWALEGKETSKIKQYAKKKSLGNDLDKLLRYGQSNQTIGLPIGPDTSHIISEIIGIGIDIELRNRMKIPPAGFRFVDDFYMCFDSRENAEDALAKLSGSISFFELKINPLKTKIIQVEELSEETWKYPIQQFKFENDHKRQKNNINHYFDLVFGSANRHSDENVMVYAVKKLKSVIIKRQNWELFESYLCRSIISFPNTIQEIAHVLSTYRLYNFISDKSRLSRTLNQVIKDHAPIEHHSEVAWALWLCKELEIIVENDACEALMETSSSVCLILAYDLHLSNLLALPFNEKKHEKSINHKELWGTSWLFAYEAARRGWMKKNNAFIARDSFFGVLDNYNIHFYDRNRTLEPIFKPHLLITIEQMEELFTSDEDIYDSFEFYEEEDDYSEMHTTVIASEDDFEIVDPGELDEDILF
jgi:hypothetical protein